jgi:hypothetical protein
MSKSSRDKGKRGEREFAKLCQEFGIKSKRNIQSREGGADNMDVEMLDLPVYHNEVKFTESKSMYAFHKQASDDANEDQVPVVWHRCINGEWMAFLPARHLLTVITALRAYERLHHLSPQCPE